MKQIIAIACIISTQLCAAQKLHDTEMYNAILSKNIFFDEKAMDVARNGFHALLSKYPESNYKPSAIYYLAEIKNKQKRTDSAELLYKLVLTTSGPDSINPSVKHNSVKRLAQIAISKKEYSKAIQYIDEANNKYLARYSCGIARIEGTLELQCLYATCFIGLKDPKRAIDSLAPHMMLDNIHLYNPNLVSLLYSAYQKAYSKKKTKEQFLNAANTIEIRKESYYGHSYLQPVMRIFNKEIKMGVHDDDVKGLPESEQKKICLDKLIRSDIYKLAVAG